jgi:hypothetical protein
MLDEKIMLFESPLQRRGFRGGLMKTFLAAFNITIFLTHPSPLPRGDNTLF